MTTPAPAVTSMPIRWRWIAAFWFAGAAFEATQAVFIQHALGKQGGEPLLFATEMAAWLPWALATPFVIGLARRHPIVPARSMRAIAVHLAALLSISFAAQAWSAALQMLLNPWAHRHAPAFWDTWGHTLVFHGLICVFAYALILAITYLVDSRDRIAREMIETAQLSQKLSHAQLAALRHQMEPHFLFNTLNAIAGLVRDDRKAAAVSMVVGLSEILRRASRDFRKPQVTLAEEVEYLQRYIEIQKLRFGERLAFSVEVPPALMDAAVPGLLIQPLVENAIKHGLSDNVAGGAIRVAAVRRGGKLVISVYNDGPVLAPGWDRRDDAVGLANLRSRLRIMHGNDAALRVGNVEGGVEVIVTLPLADVA